METMKKSVFSGLLFLACIITCFSQPSSPELKPGIPHSLNVGYFKTTSIVFPHAITGVDRGSRDILVQKARGAENILQIKAAKDHFPETNLTVITADGKLNSFVVNYSDNPQLSCLSVTSEKSPEVLANGNSPYNTAELQAYAKAAALSKRKIRGHTHRDFGIRFQLNGIFIHENIMYFRIQITNDTHIHYDISQFRFFIRDRKKAKRTASQELELRPVHTYNGTQEVKGLSGKTIVLALPKFTIPDQKHLIIQLMEAGGGRHMQLKIRNNTIIRARKLP